MARGCGRAAGCEAPGGAAPGVKGTDPSPRPRAHEAARCGPVRSGAAASAPCASGAAGWGELWSPESHSRVPTPGTCGPPFAGSLQMELGWGDAGLGGPQGRCRVSRGGLGTRRQTHREERRGWGDAATVVPRYPRGPRSRGEHRGLRTRRSMTTAAQPEMNATASNGTPRPVSAPVPVSLH